MKAGAAIMFAAIAIGTGSARVLSATPDSRPTLAPPRVAASLPTLTVTSSSFTNGGTIPKNEALKACGGSDGLHGESIGLRWSAGPAGTKSYVVTVFDTDAPTGSGFWHWIAFNIPASIHGLRLNASATGMPAGTLQGRNDYGFIGYGGPCPPPGDPPHHYYITVSALKVAKVPEATTGASGALVTFFMDPNVIAQGKLLGRYRQP
jgi:Raf kinase inhibitor-like YbhB/YbcL family protein